MPPSSYQAAARAIYEPQKAGEAATLATNEKNTINTLEASKGQIGTDYQSAVDNLNQTIQQNIGKINQLYTERLGGNFSGLQGNDLGGMFAKGEQARGLIESNRANKLSEIAVAEGNAQNTYGTEINNLTGKYQSLENKYASDTYASAQKQASTDAYRQQQLDISRARLSISAQKAAQGKTPSIAAVKQQDMTTIGNFLQGKVGKDGHVSQETWNAAMNKWVAAGYAPNEFSSQYTQFVNQRYGGYHGFD